METDRRIDKNIWSFSVVFDKSSRYIVNGIYCMPTFLFKILKGEKMKFFHLSDLHIGLRLMNYDLKKDFEYIFAQIITWAKKEEPEVIVIAGDIYDKAVPSAEAVEMFDRLMEGLVQALPKANVLIIAGNHDSATRINLFRNVLKSRKIYMIGQPPRTKEEYMEKVTVQDQYGEVNFYLLPFVRPSVVREIVGMDQQGNYRGYDASLRVMIEREHIDTSKRNVLVSHQFFLPTGEKAENVARAESEIRMVGNIDEVCADILEVFDYAALGHIHKPMKVGSEVYRYCGTPMPMSISEAGQQKGIIVVEMEEKGVVKTRVLPLNPLHQVRVISGKLEEILMKESTDYVSIQLTDEGEINVFDMQERIRRKFPNVLEVRRQNLQSVDYQMQYDPEEDMDAFSLCRTFLKDVDQEEEKLLKEVINFVQEVEGCDQ